MDEAIVQEALQKRKLRALQVLEAGLVSPDGMAHQYDVQSQSGNGRYLAATPDTFPPHGRCDCPDFEKNGEFFPCKHIQAAEYYESAERTMWAVCQQHGCTLSQLESRLLYDLCAGVPDPVMAAKLTVLLHTVQRLKDEAHDLAVLAVETEIERRLDACHGLPEAV